MFSNKFLFIYCIYVCMFGKYNNNNKKKKHYYYILKMKMSANLNKT